ncbi:MAG: TIGR03986 family type III CRISPR-associated RAMP protein [Pyrinomonadaceae bacterium]
MQAEQADVKFDLISGNPRNIEFVDNKAAAKAENEVIQQAEIQRQNAEKLEQTPETVKEESISVKKPIDTNHPKDFHNPYNFVPAIPRNHIDGKINELGDREPSGHDRYLSEKFSGKLTVQMTVKTPLLLLDTARVTVGDKEHKAFPVRVKPLIDEEGNEVIGNDGKTVLVPDINSTAVKGMLRSAYEAITNSRLSVFSEINRLAFRMEANTEFIFPALIVKKGTTSEVKILLKGNDKQIAKFELYDSNWNKKDKDKGKSFIEKKYTEKPEHYKEVWVDSRWDSRSRSLIANDIDSVSRSGWQKGWVYLTGANMKNKKYERIFLDYSSGKSFPLGNLEKDWEDLISNYQKIHEKELQKRGKQGDKAYHYLGDTLGETSWSRQIYDKNSLELEDGSLCYAYYENGQVKALLPVMISRRIFPKTPVSLLPIELHPAKLITQLSPADRVFGWVRQNKPKNEDLTEDERKLREIGAYRGQIRFGEITTKRADAIENFGATGFPLNILGQPKPQQGRFYVAEDDKGTAQKFRRTNEKAGYQDGRGLRGRKVYPHHSQIEGNDFWFQSPSANFTEQGDYWNEEFINSKGKKYFREYLRPRKDNQQQRDSQNRSIEGWVKSNTEFCFDIYFINLSDVELGALIWLLQMNNGLKEAEYFHRFGGGKPFGFGSVQLKLEETKSDIRTGQELAEQRYNSLREDAPKCENIQTNFVDKFVNAFQTVGYQNILNTGQKEIGI